MKKLSEIVRFLDKEMKVSEFNDSSNNGLQVENSGKISKVCCGVDASLEFFKAARDKGANLVICHHGLSWGDSLSRITGLNYKRLCFLMNNDMALYACHLPLDAHPKYGNNAVICKDLGLRNIKKFGMYDGQQIGFQGKFAKPIRYTAFKKLVMKITGRSDLQCMDFGKKTIQTVAVVSGGGSGELDEAAEKGVDVFLTGEPRLSAYNTAKEYGINAVFAGHYATEVQGVRALAGLMKRQFKLQAEFIDLKIKY